MSRLRNNLVFLALCPFLLGKARAQDAAVTAVAALIDPAKLLTLREDRAANLRVLKCAFKTDPVSFVRRTLSLLFAAASFPLRFAIRRLHIPA